MGVGAKMGYDRDSFINDAIAHPTAIVVIFIGSILDSVSTIIGHSLVTGVKEWNTVFLTVSQFFPFPFAVFATKASALFIIILLTVHVGRKRGPWKMCLIIPGVMWTSVGLINTVTILTSF
jgi:hypothetical protein